ncbi:MAG: hypothetical protein EPN76_09670 [Burkholderiaceae bacterium]|nr:MAG: hypothetical protein EPN76_09670 [Burkholderiaceae bacterium]
MNMAAPKNFWYVAAWASDVRHEIFPRTILNQPLVLFRASDGKVAALEDRCPHRAVPLSLGRLVGDAVRCTYHGVQIAPDGSCVHIPCQEHIPAAARARAFPIVERQSAGFVTRIFCAYRNHRKRSSGAGAGQRRRERRHGAGNARNPRLRTPAVLCEGHGVHHQYRPVAYNDLSAAVIQCH